MLRCSPDVISKNVAHCALEVLSTTTGPAETFIEPFEVPPTYV